MNPPVDVHFLMRLQPPPKGEGAHNAFLEEVNAREFMRDALALDQKDAEAFKGGFEVWAPGQTWSHDPDFPEEHHAELRPENSFWIEELRYVSTWPATLIQLLRGSERIETQISDFSEANFVRSGNRGIWVSAEGYSFRSDLLDFSRKILVAGRSFERFWALMLSEGWSQFAAAEEIGQKQVIRRRIHHVTAWKISDWMDKLERALEEVNLTEEGAILWDLLENMLEGDLPEVELTNRFDPVIPEEFAGTQLYTLHWRGLDQERKEFILRILGQYGEEGFFWKNPLNNDRAQKGWLVDLSWQESAAGPIEVMALVRSSKRKRKS